MVSTVLAESASLSLGHTSTESKGVWRARLIEADVEGSSGFYPAEVLKRDGAQAFPAGTHVYLDHPTEAEESDRPERSVKDLAGFLVDGAQYEEGVEGRGLFARIQFIPEIKERIRSLADHIGLSIRAAGEIDDTTTGRVVRSIREGLSVDVVTRAGAGGRLVNMTESKSENTGASSTSSSAGNSNNSGTGVQENRALMAEIDQLRESTSQQLGYLTEAVTKLTRLLREKQAEMEKQIQEAGDHRRAFSKIMEAKLPASSRARLVENYRPGQDLDEEIRKEAKYVEEIKRDSSRKEMKESTSGLGVTESSLRTEVRNGTSDDDFADIEAVLSGKMF